MRDVYNFIPKKEMDLIHEYSVRLLAENGVRFICDEAVEIFRSHGFRTDGDIVYITDQDVREALKTTPRTFDWYGRNSHVTVGGGEPIIAPSYGPIFVLEDGQFHKTTPRDYLNFLKLCATSSVVNVSNPNLMDFSFMPSKYADNWAMATTLMHDEHPAIGMVDGFTSAHDSIQMTQDFYGIYDKVVVTSLISASSPCHYSTAMCESLIEYAREGQGMFISPSSLHGLTSPGSLASLLLLDNMEILAGVVLSQLINPGTPVLYGNQSHGCDLRFAAPTTGSPEQFLIFYAAKAMGDYYHLPVRTGGSCCDSKQLDLQAGGESFSSMYASLKSGADLIVHAVGNLDADSSVSYDKFVYDEEVILSIKRILRGIEVNEETLMSEAIEDVGPGGNFLELEDELMMDSLEAYREEFLKLSIPNHESHGSWVKNGQKSMNDCTGKIWKQRVEGYRMPELTKDQKDVIKKYLPEELLRVSLEQ